MFTFPLDPGSLFAERSQQFVGWGIPRATVRRVQTRITDNWEEGPGGWPYEWWQEAEAAEQAGNGLQAAMLYGAARFPVAATPMRERALERQVHCFERAARGLPMHFERLLLSPPSANGNTIPVHVYAPTAAGTLPLVLLTGGVDTGKIELHRMASLLARFGRFRVAAMDMPGTGESRLALTPAADAVYRELIAALAPTGPKALVGISFGGHWAAKLALQGAVDAAIDLGGPVVVFDEGKVFVRTAPNGMAGIIANACGLACLPDDEDIEKLILPFSLRRQGLLEGNACAPLLVINGERDQYIPQQDSYLFARYPDSQVWLMRAMTHCAAEGLPRIFPVMVAWLRMHLHGKTFATRSALQLAECLLPQRVKQTSPASFRVIKA